MYDCPEDQVRRYPPAPPPAGAGGPPLKPEKKQGEARAQENAAAPAQVDPAQGNQPRAEKAQDYAPPALSGPEQGPGS